MQTVRGNVTSLAKLLNVVQNNVQMKKVSFRDTSD